MSLFRNECFKIFGIKLQVTNANLLPRTDTQHMGAFSNKHFSAKQSSKILTATSSEFKRNRKYISLTCFVLY